MDMNDLEIRIGTLRAPFSDPGFHEWSGEVVLTDDDDGPGTTIGRVGAYTVEAERLRTSFYEMCDGVSGNLEAIAADVCDDLELDCDLLGIAEWSPILILDTIQLRPEYRGQGLGPAVAALTIDALGVGCDVVLAYPSPMGDPENGKTRDEAVKALGATWAKIGFAPLLRGKDELDTWAVDPTSVKSPQT